MLFDNRIKRKNVLALNEKVAAIREFEKTPVYKHVGRSFNCSPDQIKRIIQQKDEILKAWEQRTRRCNEVKSLEMKSVRVSMLGKSVYEWIRRMMYYKDFIITDGLIQKMALQFKSALGIQVFFPHQDWCDKFRQTYKITDNDTKKLKIAYTEGHSVQIKDIIRDILGACSPNGDEDAAVKNATIEIEDDHDESEDDEDDDDENDDSENSEKEEKYEPPPQPLKQQVAKKHIGPPLLSTFPTRTALPQKRHLVTMQLPISVQNNRGTISQKVLVATPITPAGSTGGPGATPMTMTIIPLASVAQTLNCPKPQLPMAEKPIVPTPKVEIKREVIDEDVCIKKECISDDEEDMAMENVATHYNEHEKENSNASPKSAVRMQSKESSAANTPMDTELSEEEDNLALAQLKKGLANNSTSHVATTTPTQNNSTWMTAIPLQTENNSNSPHSLPAMPPLTRAPTAKATTSSSSSPASTTRKRHAIHNNSPTLPPIRTCAEARKYLKLLEDFALVRENFRLIGLITRADEVLRELDGDEDVDIE